MTFLFFSFLYDIRFAVVCTGHWRCDSSRVARAFSKPNYVFSRVEQGDVIMEPIRSVCWRTDLNMKVRPFVVQLSFVIHADGLLCIGPVRVVAIHPSRALQVTGGDDYKINIWGELDFIRAPSPTDVRIDIRPQRRRCLFTLPGHLITYALSSSFMNDEIPWIVSRDLHTP